jgi:hypothetical protein
MEGQYLFRLLKNLRNWSKNGRRGKILGLEIPSYPSLIIVYVSFTSNRSNGPEVFLTDAASFAEHSGSSLSFSLFQKVKHNSSSNYESCFGFGFSKNLGFGRSLNNRFSRETVAGVFKFEKVI